MNLLECIPCVLSNTLRTLDTLETDDSVRKEVLQRALLEVRAILDGASAPEVTKEIFQTIKTITGNPDPYSSFKKASTEKALEIFPRLQKKVSRSPDPFAAAIELSVAGNTIDLVTLNPDELPKVIEWLENLSDAKFAVNDIKVLEREVAGAKTILVIGDNAGETVFDKLFLELINVPELYYGVRGAPVLNDVIDDDAVASGIVSPIRIISSGSSMPGTSLSDSSEEFNEVFQRADVVIAKGQGNFETLDDSPRCVYHLFKVKCSGVAGQVGCDVGDFVVWRRDNKNK